MIYISITAAALEAIAATSPVGSVAYETGRTAKGEVRIWLAPDVVNKLHASRGQERATACDHQARGRISGLTKALEKHRRGPREQSPFRRVD
jgi:hypothetical protein